MSKDLNLFKPGSNVETYRISNSATGTAGKAMVLMGFGALTVPLAAAILPLIGTIILALVIMGVGAFLAE